MRKLLETGAMTTIPLQYLENYMVKDRAINESYLEYKYKTYLQLEY